MSVLVVPPDTDRDVTQRPPGGGTLEPLRALAAWLNADDVAGVETPPSLRPPISNTTLVIGRSRWCELVLDDVGISRQHASLRYEAGRWTLADLGSTNGTFVNGWRVTAPTRIHVGDLVQLAETIWIFEPR
jgi:hypothetical protein